jgi:hypothetical protein
MPGSKDFTPHGNGGGKDRENDLSLKIFKDIENQKHNRRLLIT